MLALSQTISSEQTLLSALKIEQDRTVTIRWADVAGNTVDEYHFIGADLIILHAALGNPGVSSKPFLDLLTPGGNNRDDISTRKLLPIFFNMLRSYTKHSNRPAAEALLKTEFAFRRKVIVRETLLTHDDSTFGMNLFIIFITI